MKKSCFDKKYKCVSFIVHYKGLTLRGLHISGVYCACNVVMTIISLSLPGPILSLVLSPDQGSCPVVMSDQRFYHYQRFGQNTMAGGRDSPAYQYKSMVHFSVISLCALDCLHFEGSVQRYCHCYCN